MKNFLRKTLVEPACLIMGKKIQQQGKCKKCVRISQCSCPGTVMEWWRLWRHIVSVCLAGVVLLCVLI